jgi:1-acyl-sn-glycerol-3-phosphate acyltransferase
MLYQILRNMFRCIYTLLFRCEVHGTENVPLTGPLIIAANHMSNWDPPLLGSYMARPICYMAKQELFDVPGLGWILRTCHSFPIKRGAGDRGAIKTALAILQQQRCMALFPEGTRSRNGKMHKAEAGVGLIAALSKAPVVPVAIIGTDRICNQGHFLPKLQLIYGKPLFFTAERNDKTALQDFSQQIMENIAIMKKTYERK